MDGVEVDGRAAAPSRCHARRGTTLRDSSVAFATISVRIGEVGKSATTRDNELIMPRSYRVPSPANRQFVAALICTIRACPRRITKQWATARN